MSNLCIYNLDFEKTVDYVTKYLEDGNELAKYLLSNLNFSKGKFFLYATEEINIQKIYDFKYGGLIKSNYKNKKSAPIPNVDKELSSYLFDELVNSELQIIFEDIINESSSQGIEIDNAKLSIINNHLYYVIKNPMSEETIFVTLKTTKEIWYSFFVVTAELTKDEILSTSVLYKVIKGIKQFFIGAYDGEGYISWSMTKKQ